MKIRLVRKPVNRPIPIREPCARCGAIGHQWQACELNKSFPVRRGFGWPGWEAENEERGAMFAAAKTGEK